MTGDSSDFEPLDFELMTSSFFADFTSTTGSFFGFSLGVGTRWTTGSVGTAGATGPGVAEEGFCWVREVGISCPGDGEGCA
jgi:hypothetical protein